MNCFAFRRWATVAAGATMLAIGAASQAVITFSNVNIAGTPQLIAGATFATGATDIDFTFPNAVVGDFQPLRQGTITITYEAQSQTAIAADQMVLSVLGGLLGSGQVQFSEVIEDLVNPGVIGFLAPVTVTSNSQLPWTGTIQFSRPSTHIKVKKEFFLMAQPDTQALDIARISLVEQNLVLVPEPGTMAALGFGVAAIAARRRRRK